jgi:hypothetical protein
VDKLNRSAAFDAAHAQLEIARRVHADHEDATDLHGLPGNPLRDDWKPGWRLGCLRCGTDVIVTATGITDA